MARTATIAGVTNGQQDLWPPATAGPATAPTHGDQNRYVKNGHQNMLHIVMLHIQNM